MKETISHLSTIAVVVALLAVVRSSPTLAAQIEGVEFSDRYQTSATELRLQCVGLLRYKVIFKGYVAALYLDERTPPADVLNDVPKRLELSYFWNIDGDEFGPAGEKILAQNFDRETLDRMRPQLEKIDALYRDVEPGDRYSLTYIPGVGTELALNGVRRGVIEGADFAAKYFAIWLGPRPLDASLKDQLVSCSKKS